jgi:hypothetical protein
MRCSRSSWSLSDAQSAASISRTVSPVKALSRFHKAGPANCHEVMRQANRRLQIKTRDSAEALVTID